MIILNNRANKIYSDKDKIDLNSIYDLMSLRNIGIYKLFIDEKIFQNILDGLKLKAFNTIDIELLIFNNVEYYCVYVGQASSSFLKRIIADHILGINSSTLRKSLESIFMITNTDLNNVYKNHSIFVMLPENNKDALNGLEKRIINENYRPLNITHNNYYKKKSKNKDYFEAGNELKRLRSI